MSNGSLHSSVNAARLCHIIQWKHFDGYGFNLHAEKGKPGQYIGKVDEGSPAEAAGLKQGDRIIEVNGVNIANENHKQVVQRIKAIPNETKLLVVDAEADKYYKSNNVTITSSLPEVQHLKTPMPEGDVDMTDEKQQETGEDSQSMSSNTEANPEKRLSSSASTPSSDRKSSHDYSAEGQTELTVGNDSALKSPESNKGTTDQNTVNGSINLSMTAKELREKLASRKKYDPKKDSMDFKKKFEIVQTL